jgi:hypothetical protein
MIRHTNYIVPDIGSYRIRTSISDRIFGCKIYNHLKRMSTNLFLFKQCPAAMTYYNRVLLIHLELFASCG